LEVNDEAHPSTQIHERNGEKLLKIRGWKIGWKYSKNHKKEKWSIQLGDKIHALTSAILREIKRLHGVETITTSSHSLEDWRDLSLSLLSSHTMKHTHTSQKATMARWWERVGWMLAYPPALGVLFIDKLMTKLPLRHNTMKMVMLG
jgi:hypothetical protein